MKRTSGSIFIGSSISFIMVLVISVPTFATVGWEIGDMVLDFGVTTENGENEVLLDQSEMGAPFWLEIIWKLDPKACHLQIRQTQDEHSSVQVNDILDDGLFGGNPAHAQVSKIEALLFSAQPGKDCSIEAKRDEFVILSSKQRTKMKESKESMPAPLGATVMVLRATSFFTPNVVTIQAGEKVVWIYADGAKEPHSVTSGQCRGPDCSGGGQDFSSGPTLKIPGHRFEHIFTKAGTYPYHCDLHGGSMQGTVIVKP